MSTMDMQPKRWPFDVDAVTKGSVVMSAEQIDEYANATRESNKRRLALLRLAAMLRRGLQARGHVGWTICEKDQALVVLSDAEATIYNQKRTDDAVRVIAESTHRLVHVDESALTAEQSEEHQRRLMRNSYLLNGLRAAKKEFRAAISDRDQKKRIE